MRKGQKVILITPLLYSTSSSQDITKISRKSSSHIQNAANKDIGANPLSQVNLVSYVLGVV
jgi:hypothetical protein